MSRPSQVPRLLRAALVEVRGRWIGLCSDQGSDAELRQELLRLLAEQEEVPRPIHLCELAPLAEGEAETERLREWLQRRRQEAAARSADREVNAGWSSGSSPGS